MPEIIKVTCPNCSTQLGVTAQQLGRRVKCPNCQHPFAPLVHGKTRTSDSECARPCGYEYMVAPQPAVEETVRPCGYEYMIDALPAISGSETTAVTGVPESYGGSLKPLTSVRRQLKKAMELRDFAAAAELAEEIVNVVDACGHFGCSRTDDYKTWARTARERENYAEEVAIAEKYLARLPHPPFAVHEFEMIDILADARERLRRYVPGTGTCQMCEDANVKLTRIDSRDTVCARCLRGFGKPFKVRTYDRRQIEAQGLELSQHPTKDEFIRLSAIALRRELELPDDASEDEVRKRQIPPAKGCTTFATWITGVTFRNANRTRRQDIIECCHLDEKLQLIREPDNRHDAAAVKVCRMNGEQIGYLRSFIAGQTNGIGWDVAGDLDAGCAAEAVITEIKGIPGQLGVQIDVTIWETPATQSR